MPGFTGHEGKFWLYALGLSDGRVKVGFTGQPRVRLQQHRVRYEYAITWFHLGPRLGSKASALAAELALCGDLADRFARASGRETFHAANKACVIRAMRSAADALRS